MKRFLLLLLTVVSIATFTNCSKETTYTFIDITDYSSITSLKERTVHIFEYDAAGSRIVDNRLDSPIHAKEYTFTASEQSEKVKVYLDYVLQSGSTTINADRWIQVVYLLEPGNNIIIEVNEKTLVGPSEPQ